MQSRLYNLRLIQVQESDGEIEDLELTTTYLEKALKRMEMVGNERMNKP
jgi:hypothetical protein